MSWVPTKSMSKRTHCTHKTNENRLTESLSILWRLIERNVDYNRLLLEQLYYNRSNQINISFGIGNFSFCVTSLILFCLTPTEKTFSRRC